MYKNYHKHDHYGNPWAMDVVVKPEEYCKRAVELGHDSVFTVNHGVTGNIFEWIELSKKYGLKMHYGMEAYYVKDRFEKDRSNKHLIIIAKNNDGVMQLNDIMTEAHSTGFYYKPRIDYNLLLSLDPNNFIITSACVAGIWNEPELILALHRKFGKNFFLEVQAHSIKKQIEVNTEVLRLSKETGIPIIHANDSHYIYPEDSKYRDILQKAKNIYYDFEENMVLDYPDENEIYRRYEKQGVLSKDQVRSALENTMIFDECEEITLINDDIKLPSVSQQPMEDLKSIIRERWKIERKNIPKELWKQYTDAILYELDIVEKTNMANYFLIDYHVAKDGQEKYDGRLTNTGRGSAPSFYITKLLGLTDIDRVSAPITLFPTRFMSVERILGTRSLPDIDLNTTDRVPFIQATEDLLGADNCAWMLAWKPLQDSSAFRTFCKGIGKDISEYDDVAKNLELYENDNKWKDIIRESKRFVGVIESISESPCSMLLYDKPVRKELGLVRTSKDKLCCLLDGYNCDKYKYLKNDYLTVTVWAIIRDVCKLAKIPIPTIKEIDDLFDQQTFDIYRKGLTSTINQADSDYATGLVTKYCPQNISEMSAFVAIIRPGCLSLLQDFIGRKSYTTGVPELDDILVDGNHRMIYQELIMKYLIWLGIPETHSYDIIKKIAKKKFKEEELTELKNKLLNGWKKRVGKEEGFIETWTVVEQAAHYSFNACVSGDTLIQKAGITKSKYNPTVEEMYKIMNDIKYAKENNHLSLHRKYQSCGYGNALSMFDDGRIRTNSIVDIRQSGIRNIYRITTENGSFLDCTDNHKFPTPQGKKKLSELNIGDLLYVKGSCETFDNSKFELHHKDLDRTNNDNENLMWLCNSCHKKTHYKIGRRKCCDKGIPTELQKIVSIEFLKTDMTYDIEMADPAHTFISDSGLVTSNSHSLSYAYDSLYGAYLKAHYPLEYYTVALNYYNDDAERTLKLTNELQYFGIQLKPIKFRFSTSDYALSKIDNNIYKGIKSIKDMNAKVADEIFELRNNQYNNFLQLLQDIYTKTSAKKNQIKILIQLDFFEEFGDANVLYAEFEFYNQYRKRSQFKKNEIGNIGIPLEIIQKYAGKETEKMFADVDGDGLCLEFCKNLEHTVPKSRLCDKIKYQIDYLGYISIKSERYSGMACVLSIDTKYSPKLKMYSLKNGTTLECKIDKKTFNKDKLHTGDIVRIKTTKTKPKVTRKADGTWENVPDTKELWITSYIKVENI